VLYGVAKLCKFCAVDERLPEGVRVLSVIVSTEEYNDLMTCCSSDQQPNNVNDVIPAPPRLVTDYNKDKTDNDNHPIVDAVDNSVGVDVLDQTDEVFASNQIEQCQSQHPDIHHATTVYSSSAVSGKCVKQRHIAV